MEDTIKMLVDDYLLIHDEFNVAMDINDGYCGDFADDIKERVPGAKVIWGDELTEDFWQMEDEGWMSYCAPNHCFVEYEGKYYDSEAPSGVDHPRDLPYYQRELEYTEMHC